MAEERYSLKAGEVYRDSNDGEAVVVLRAHLPVASGRWHCRVMALNGKNMGCELTYPVWMVAGMTKVVL